MAINFPSSPTDGQTVTSGNSTYTYNSAKATWDLSTAVVAGPTGPTGATGAASTVTGPTGATGATGPAYTPAITTVTTTYSTQATDANKIINSTGTTGYTITVANVLTAGQWIDVVQSGTGQITFAAGAGVTLGSSGGKLKTNAQYSAATIICTGSGTYVVVGDLAA